VRPVELAFQLIELLSLHQPVGVSELARLAGIPKSTVQRSLMALHKTGWIELADADRPVWSLSMRALVASGRANYEHSVLRGIAIPVMEELRRESEETVHLTYRFERSLVLLERLDGIKPVRYFFPYGAVSPLHATSSGRAILSMMPQDELDAYLSQPLDAVTSLTVVDPEIVRSELAEARERGYAVTFGGNRSDVHAVGAAIVDRHAQPFAAISISAPAERLDASLAERYGPLVADAARRVTLGVTSQPHFH